MSTLIPEEKGPFKSLLLFGPPGSGKGTLGRFLSSAGNHYHLSSGDIFRGLSPESEAGKIFHKYAGTGRLVPDEVTIEIWRHYVGGLIATNAYFPHQQLLLLDGLPRTLTQKKLLEPFVDVVQIVVLEILDIEVLIQRLKRRAMIERRMDDFDENILKTRMQVFQDETVSVLSHFPKNLITKVNADQAPLEVLRDVLIKFSSLLSKKHY